MYIYIHVNIQIGLLIDIVVKSLLDCYWIDGLLVTYCTYCLLDQFPPYWYRLMLPDPSQMNQAGLCFPTQRSSWTGFNQSENLWEPMGAPKGIMIIGGNPIATQ